MAAGVELRDCAGPGGGLLAIARLRLAADCYTVGPTREAIRAFAMRSMLASRRFPAVQLGVAEATVRLFTTSNAPRTMIGQ